LHCTGISARAHLADAVRSPAPKVCSWNRGS
jgi:hypothetical protein